MQLQKTTLNDFQPRSLPTHFYVYDLRPLTIKASVYQLYCTMLLFNLKTPLFSFPLINIAVQWDVKYIKLNSTIDCPNKTDSEHFLKGSSLTRYHLALNLETLTLCRSSFQRTILCIQVTIFWEALPIPQTSHLATSKNVQLY